MNWNEGELNYFKNILFNQVGIDKLFDSLDPFGNRFLLHLSWSEFVSLIAAKRR